MTDPNPLDPETCEHCGSLTRAWLKAHLDLHRPAPNLPFRADVALLRLGELVRRKERLRALWILDQAIEEAAGSSALEQLREVRRRIAQGDNQEGRKDPLTLIDAETEKLG